MRILFLGYDVSKTTLIDYLKSKGHQVHNTSNKIESTDVQVYDWVVSFGYRHLIKKSVIDSIGGKIINLHISYLPYNRGSHPLFWAIYDKTPIGITIHQVDEGLDTGDIYVQKEVSIDVKTETFQSAYNILMQEIEELFKQNCDDIFLDRIIKKKQVGIGTYHKSSDLPEIKSWDTNIHRYFDMSSRTDSEIIDDIEKIRARNNVNWMDAVRLAFELSPERARLIFKDIKECDARINELLTELANNDEKN